MIFEILFFIDKKLRSNFKCRFGRIRIISTDGIENRLCVYVVCVMNAGLQTPGDLRIEKGRGGFVNGETGFFLYRSF
jgi:hypothetical protein